MIARIWKGWTTLENAAAYETLFREVVVPKVTAGVQGFRTVNLLKHVGAEEVEFTTIFWFDSMAAVKQFAGENYQQAVVPEPVRGVLLRYAPTVQHCDVVI